MENYYVIILAKEFNLKGLRCCWSSVNAKKLRVTSEFKKSRKLCVELVNSAEHDCANRSTYISFGLSLKDFYFQRRFAAFPTKEP
jgi:hypothetical protein